MNREHFLERLSELLAKVPEAEREEMLQYYRDYFEDAGGENEAEVLCTLGSPEAVAEGLLRDLGETPVMTASPGDRAVVEYGKTIREESVFPPVSAEGPTGQTSREVPEQTSNRLSAGMLVLIIILLLFALPIMIPLALAAVAVVFALIVAGSLPGKSVHDGSAVCGNDRSDRHRCRLYVSQSGSGSLCIRCRAGGRRNRFSVPDCNSTFDRGGNTGNF